MTKKVDLMQKMEQVRANLSILAAHMTVDRNPSIDAAVSACVASLLKLQKQFLGEE